MSALRSVSLLLAGISLLFVVAAGTMLYAMQVEEPTLRFQPAGLSIANNRDSCVQYVRLYSVEAFTNRERATLWHAGVKGILAWGLILVLAFAWVYRIARKYSGRTLTYWRPM